MSENTQKQSPTEAEGAYMAAIESEPMSKRALAHVLTKLRSFAESVRLANSLRPKALKTFFSVEHWDDCLGLDVKDLGQSLYSDRSATVIERIE